MASDSFQLGKDIEKFYELHQQLSMDDLARRKVMHTKVHLVRVLSKVIRNLEKPAELDTYLRCIGRLHQLAGVDSSYLSMSGKSFFFWENMLGDLMIDDKQMLAKLGTYLVLYFDIVSN